MKIIVYAITKNESKFIDRWYNSMKEADDIYVLDTGSTDDTVELLQKLNVHVKQEIIKPWRFDVARNKSLDMVPDDVDICVCTDIDEIFAPGWRQVLEEKFKNANRCRYNYIWSFDKYGNPAVNFYQEKIHTRKGYTWVNPVHEVLKCSLNGEKIVTLDEITLKHYPDSTKSRSSYLPLLELAVKEDPNNDRNMHYLGREYMFYGKYDDAITTLKKHLSMPTSTWDEERSASERFISRCYTMLNNLPEALKHALRSISECSTKREPYFETAYVYYLMNNYEASKSYLLMCLNQNNNNKSYINDPACYNGTVEDLLSVCEYYLGNYKTSLKWSKKALKLDPENTRIINNKELISQKIY